MKVLIDIPKKMYEDCKVRNTGHYSLYDFSSMITNATPIPDNATNGDAIKVMFPSIESRLDKNTGIMLVKWVDGTTKTFKASWWNSPYKKEVEKDG